jgi:hypothetical protein
MSDPVGRFAELDSATGMLSLPLWMAGALAAFFLVLSLIAFSRAGREGLIGALARVALVVIGAGVTWFIVEGAGRRDLAADRRALDARASELLTRAAMPGSALACLDARAGETVETSCEKALFASPEATAAAVAYVSAQLVLLADMSEHVRRTRSAAPYSLRTLRRATEADRYGFTAHVLAERDGCTAAACPALSLFNDARHVTANLGDETYDLYVIRHAATWPVAAKSPVASLVPATPPAPPHPGSNTGGIFLPSSASIPPVNIMNAEPQLPPDNTAAVPAAPVARQAPPPRRPAQTNAQPKTNGRQQQPVDLNAITGSVPPSFAPQQ